MNFEGKTAVVTGAANGIGRAVAIGFAAGGANLVLVDRDAAGLEATAAMVRQRNAKAVPVTADVTRSAEVEGYVKAALDAFGRIDCFFNNAGIEGKIGHTAEYDEAMFDQVIAVNLKGVFLGLRHVLPVMIRQKAGAVVNTASVAGISGTPGMPAYCASKHAVLGLTKTAAGETARAGVRINAICPGPIDTRMIHSIEGQIDPGNPSAVEQRYQSSLPIGRYGTADEVANLVLFLCSDLAANMTGGQYVTDGGRTAVGGPVSAASR